MRLSLRWPLAAAIAVAALGQAASAAAGGAGDKAAPGFCLLAVEEDGGSLAILEPGGALRKRLKLGERPHEIAVSPDGRTAFVTQFGIADYDNRIGTPGTSVVRIDLATGRETARYSLPAGLRAPHGVQLRPPAGAELFVNTEVGDPTMLVFDAASGALKRRFPLPAGTHNFIFTADGAGLFAFAGAGGVWSIDPLSGSWWAHADLGSPVRGLAMTRDDRAILAGARGAVFVLDPQDLRLVRRLAAAKPGQVAYLLEAEDGSILAPSINDAGLTIFPKGQEPGQFVATGDTPLRAVTGPDGRTYIANVTGRRISVIDGSGATIQTIAGLEGPNGVAFGACPARP